METKKIEVRKVVYKDRIREVILINDKYAILGKFTYIDLQAGIEDRLPPTAIDRRSKPLVLLSDFKVKNRAVKRLEASRIPSLIKDFIEIGVDFSHKSRDISMLVQALAFELGFSKELLMDYISDKCLDKDVRLKRGLSAKEKRSPEEGGGRISIRKDFGIRLTSEALKFLENPRAYLKATSNGSLPALTEVDKQEWV